MSYCQATEYNITPYMAAADTLVSEASSTVFDFLALGKCGVIYDLPCERLKHSDGKPLLTEDNGEFLKDAFVHVQSPDQLRMGIERALHPSAEMRVAADRERDYYFYQLDGQASRSRLKGKNRGAVCGREVWGSPAERCGGWARPLLLRGNLTL